MTEEQKVALISKMLDAPSSLSDEETDAILRDEELRDMYETSSAVSSAFIRQPELDMDAEWMHFSRRLRRKPTAMRRFVCIAAIFLGMMLVSGIVTMIVDDGPVAGRTAATARLQPIGHPGEQPVGQQPERIVEIDVAVEAGTVAERNRLAQSSCRRAKADADTSMDVAWRVEGEVDVEEFLRIQQARIDNDLAVLASEAYREEYDDIVSILDAAGVYNHELDNVIREITME